MFTGIVETTGKLEAVQASGSGLEWLVSSPISGELKVDQSVAHQGVCLTVVHCDATTHRVVAVRETLDKSNLGLFKPGDPVNLERCLRMGDRLDGHWVQGHVDTTGLCVGIEDLDGSWSVTVEYPESYGALLVPKGSITVDGVSLTLVEAGRSQFKVVVIPYTFAHTTLGSLRPGHKVNLEFDLLGKYFLRQSQWRLESGPNS